MVNDKLKHIFDNQKLKSSELVREPIPNTTLTNRQIRPSKFGGSFNVLQLALSVDYAVIFLNRYKEEHQALPYREATIVALSKSIPEISGSSLTTMGGLIAMLFMQFGIGSDMGIVLIKAILLSLLSVFLLMPGIIMVFAGLMEKTQHKNFIPKIPFVGKSNTTLQIWRVVQPDGVSFSRFTIHLRIIPCCCRH